MKIGYVSGETIAFTVSINNQASRKITSVELRLMQSIRLITKARARQVGREVAKVCMQKEIDGLSKADWTSNGLVIPSVCPSSLKTSRVLQVSYFVMLEVEPKWPAKTITIRQPIVVASIPIDGRLEPVYRESELDLNVNSSVKIESGEEFYKPLYPVYSQWIFGYFKTLKNENMLTQSIYVWFVFFS